MKKIISIVLVLALGLTAEVANADFTFGEPVNLGPPINSVSSDHSACISTDGLLLYFTRGEVAGEIWQASLASSRVTTEKAWGPPSNMGSIINSPNFDGGPSISADGLSLYFFSDRPGGPGGPSDLWVATRATVDDNWGTPVNLEAPVNSVFDEYAPSISADGLELYFTSDRPGGSGNWDIWVTTRATTDDNWGDPTNLGSKINTSAQENWPGISPDGLLLFFGSNRSGGLGNWDLYMARRATTKDPWGPPVNLGPVVNGTAWETGPKVSPNGSMLYFQSPRSGGFGSSDIWQVSIDPVVDLNGDGIVDCADMCEMVDHWGTDEQLYDIGPMPWGDGIVDVQDLIILAEHLFEGIPTVELEEVNVDEGDDGSQVELEQGQILVVTLESNPTTGYSWEVAEIQEYILQQMGEAEFKQSQTGGPPLVGAGGWEIFRFKAISAGQMTLQLVYRRPWEEGVEPIKTFSIQVVVN